MKYVLTLMLLLTLPCPACPLEVTLKNFKHVRCCHGEAHYSSVVEEGIPARKHILVVRNCKCLDDAEDAEGNPYYFYMVDMYAGLKALVTPADLKPVEVDGDIEEFVRRVERELEKDGGFEAVVQKFG
jgi:hypothetical protein